MDSGTDASPSPLASSSVELLSRSATPTLSGSRGDRRKGVGGGVMEVIREMIPLHGCKVSILKIWHSPQPKMSKKRMVTVFLCRLPIRHLLVPRDTWSSRCTPLEPVRTNRLCTVGGCVCPQRVRLAVCNLQNITVY